MSIVLIPYTLIRNWKVTNKKKTKGLKNIRLVKCSRNTSTIPNQMPCSLKVLATRKKGFKYHVNWGLLFFMRFDDYILNKKKSCKKGLFLFFLLSDKNVANY